MSAPLTLHIDRLVIDGLALTHADGLRLQRAMEQELAQLWQARDAGATPAGHAAPALRAPSAGGASASPAQLGRQVAHSVFDSLGLA